MRKVLIYSLDTNENVAILYEGKFVFGHGDQVKCAYKQVSCIHAILSVTSQQVSLTSTHVKPCFIKAKNSSSITILPCDVTAPLNDGDKFALLPEQYWFQLTYTDSEKEDPENNEQGSFTKEENGSTALLKSNIKDQNDIIIRSYSIKREREEDDLSCKKLKVEKSKHEDSNEMVQPLDEIKKESFSESDDDNTFVQTKKQYSDQSNNQEPSESITEETNKNAPNNGFIKKERTDHIKDDEEKQIDSVVTQPPEEFNSGEVKIEKDVQQANLPFGTVASDNTDHDLDKVVTHKKHRRDRCWYGADCYRKNPLHKEEFSHPGNSDYESDKDDDRPQCPYGENCYQRNKLHRQQYKHPKTTERGKRKRTRNKKNKVANDEESSEDDYDYEDPFLNDDSSDDYTADDSDDDDDDDDDEWSGAEVDEEDTKRLLKEAKRFTRNKKT